MSDSEGAGNRGEPIWKGTIENDNNRTGPPPEGSSTKSIGGYLRGDERNSP